MVIRATKANARLPLGSIPPSRDLHTHLSRLSVTRTSTRSRSANRYSRYPVATSGDYPPRVSPVSPCSLDRRVEELEAIALTDRTADSAVYPESDRDRSEDIIDCLTVTPSPEYGVRIDERPQRINRRLDNRWLREMETKPRIPQFECIDGMSSDSLLHP